MINISRKRWVIVRDDGYMFCGLARKYEFKPIDNIGNTAIKTYLSRNKAIASFERSWNDYYDDNRYRAVEVDESIVEAPHEEN